MAYWSIAMTYYHPIWTAPDSTELAAGRAAVEKALGVGERTERELAYIRAIEAYYQGLDEPALAEAAGPSCRAPGGVNHRGRAACFRRGAARAAQAASNRTFAREHYQRLIEQEDGDGRRAEIAEARVYIKRS